MWDTDVRDAALIDLGWDEGPRNRQYRAVAVAAKSEYLDYALVRVTPTRGLGADDIAVEGVRLARRSPVSGEALMLIHHPMCLPKQISRINCKAGRRVESWRPAPNGEQPLTDFVHKCDSEGGSSGGAVFESGGGLLGLHHLGFELDNQCQRVTQENRAVAVDAILEDIRVSAPEIYREISPG